jgi:hypothetical protein
MGVSALKQFQAFSRRAKAALRAARSEGRRNPFAKSALKKCKIAGSVSRRENNNAGQKIIPYEASAEPIEQKS